MAGIPQRAVELFSTRLVAAEVHFDTVHESESGGVEKARCGASFDQTARGTPLSESNCIGQSRTAAENGTRRFDVRAGIEQCVEGLGVVAARGPMQRRLAVGADERCVHVGARGDELLDDRTDVWEMARPVRRDVQ